MCLAAPGRIIERRGDEAIADLQGNALPVSTLMTPEVEVGDWVLIHAGFVIQKLNEAEAMATWAVLADAARVAVDRETVG